MLVLAAGLSAQSNPPPKEPPPQVPPASLPLGHWNMSYDVLDKTGKVTKFTGRPGFPAEMEDQRMLFRADVIEYDEETGDVTATGHVYYRNFLKNEQVWASRLEYNTEGEHGIFYDVRGEMRPRMVAHPGVLSVNAPVSLRGRVGHARRRPATRSTTGGSPTANSPNRGGGCGGPSS